jgi:fatty acid synthase subunit alpha
VHSQKDLDAVDATAELESNWEATLDLFARFLGFVRGSLHGDQQSFRARTSLLASVLAYFTATYLTERDIPLSRSYMRR